MPLFKTGFYDIIMLNSRTGADWRTRRAARNRVALAQCSAATLIMSVCCSLAGITLLATQSVFPSAKDSIRDAFGAHCQ
jgi:hypothetical protein